MIDFAKLRDIREDNDIKQKDMAKFLGVKRPAYSLWELGINVIPLEKLVLFADYFNYSIDYVLGLSKTKTNPNLRKGINLQVLGENLKKLRVQKGLSQAKMADLLKVRQSCITKYEKGLIWISVSNLYEYSKIFKVAIDELCGKIKHD